MALINSLPNMRLAGEKSVDSCTADRYAISMHGRQPHVPVLLAFVAILGQLLSEVAVETLHHAIRLRVEGRGPSLPHSQKFTTLPKDIGLKLPALIGVQFGRHAKASEKLTHQNTRHRLGANASGHLVK